MWAQSSMSECTSAETATRLHVAGAKKLITHCALEGPMLSMENLLRVFGKCALGEMPATSKEMPPSTSVDLRGFLSLVVMFAFYRQNPKQGLFASAAKEGAEGKPGKDSAAPVAPNAQTISGSE